MGEDSFSIWSKPTVTLGRKFRWLECLEGSSTRPRTCCFLFFYWRFFFSMTALQYYLNSIIKPTNSILRKGSIEMIRKYTYSNIHIIIDFKELFNYWQNIFIHWFLLMHLQLLQDWHSAVVHQIHDEQVRWVSSVLRRHLEGIAQLENRIEVYEAVPQQFIVWVGQVD